ncbi:hypothetical protein BHM03_00001666 [Ensete ventricosum]|nr:hypothetical protein BHM03_00001666 [Ensete ventricosum]
MHDAVRVISSLTDKFSVLHVEVQDLKASAGPEVVAVAASRAIDLQTKSDVVPGASGDSYGVVPGSQAVGTTSDDRRHFKISGGSAVSRSQAVGTVSDERHRFEISGGDDVSRSRATSTTLGGQCRPEISGDGYTSRCRGVWGELTWLI